MISKACVVIAVAGLSTAAASANPLNLSLRNFPDVSATQIDVNYTAGTLTLSTSGFTVAYEDDGLASTPPHQVFGGTMTISMLVSATGVATPGSGTLTVTGSIPDLSIPNSTLLSGSILNFGFENANPTRLEFIFNNLSGMLSPVYIAQGPFAGVIMSNVSGFPGGFGGSWNNLTNNIPGTGGAVADIGAVPAPASVGFLSIGALALRRRRR